MYRIIIDSEVFDEIQKAVDWYNKKQETLGDEFFWAFERETLQLKQNPYINAVRYDFIRCKLIGKFPYMIHYEISEQF